MREYDDAVLECFLDKQLQLFPEPVAETLDEAEDYAMEVYNDLKNGKSVEYLNDSIYRPNEGMCITSVSIHEYDTEDNNYNEFIEGYGFEPYVQ